jgi:peptidoglycan/LPS O-acetylase OafA/YrhL
LFNKFQIDINHFFLSLLFISKTIFNKFPAYPLVWTLEYELLFYIFFGFFIILFKKRTIIFIIFVSIFLILLSFTIDVIFIEFLFGIFIGVIFLKKNKKIINFLSKYSIILIALGLIGLFLPLFISLDFNRAIKLGLPSFFLVLGLVFSKQTSNKFLIFLGDSSYSLYLSHLLVLGFFFKISKIFISSIDPVLIVLFSIFFCLLINSFLYLKIEKKINAYFK